MVGGLDTLRNRLLSAAGAVVLVAALGHTPSKAADLGGDCCADLEERVAELEATTARKGNKKVTVTLYGKMNWALEWWNDGHEQSMYTVNNYMESSRFGLKGSAKINADWSAGYRLEVETREAASQQLNQFNDNNAQDPLGPLNMRWSSMYINNKTWGEVRWGLTATPKYNITKDPFESISQEPGEGGGLEDTLVADFRMNDSFKLVPRGPNAIRNANGLSTISWSNIARCFSSSDQFNCSPRRNGVVYWSPKWEGFSASVGAFEDRDWSSALRYEKTWGDTWDVAAGAAYEQLRDERLQIAGGGDAGFSRDFEEEAGSAAIKHKPTGLFVYGVWSTSESNDTNAIGAFNGKEPPLMTAWALQGGIQRKMPWFSLDKLGETAFWGGFEDVRNGFAQGSSAVSGTTPVLDSAVAGTKLGAVPANGLISGSAFPGVLDPKQKYQFVGSDVPMWFLALDQQLASAAMHVYLVYQHFDEPDVSLIDSSKDHVSVPLEGFDLFYLGGRLYF